MVTQPSTIDRFKGEDCAFLSNFYPVQGIITAEHMYQAAKPVDPQQMIYIMSAPTPRISKRRGRECTLRSDWEDMKMRVMYDVLLWKFSKSSLANALISTGDAMLIEGNNWHDNEWGDCFCRKCCNITGRNYLGQLLMMLREQLKGI